MNEKILNYIDKYNKLKNIENIKFAGFSLYEKKEPFYNSEFLGIPFKWIVITTGILYALKIGAKKIGSSN